jgi:dihydropteroate synthase
MQENPQYEDVVADVRTFLAKRAQACMEAGIPEENIILDPGFGFGKTMQQNFELLNRLEEVRSMDLPVLAGLSRKSMIGHALDLPVEQRKHASVGLALMAVWNGANIVRVHDVKETSDALRMVEAVRRH